MKEKEKLSKPEVMYRSSLAASNAVTLVITLGSSVEVRGAKSLCSNVLEIQDMANKLHRMLSDSEALLFIVVA